MNATVGEWIDGGKINIANVTLTDGLGHTMTDRRGLFVVHAVLLHTGMVLWFCGHVEDGHYALKSYLFDYKAPSARLVSHDFPLHNPSLARGSVELGGAEVEDGTDIDDDADADDDIDADHDTDGTELDEPTSEDPSTPGDFHADLFCCHFVHAPDGKVIVVGGADPDYLSPAGGAASHGSVGEPYVYAFDPDANSQNGQWQVVMEGSEIARLAEGRWYPTAVALGDGRIAVFSGRREHASFISATSWQERVSHLVEILTPGAPGSYTVSTLTSADIAFPVYPGLHLAPNGRIYYTHTTWGLEFDPPANTQSIEIVPEETDATWTDHAGVHPSQPRREEGMSVLLPPAQDGRILLFGGSEAIGVAAPATTRTRNLPRAPFNHIANSSDPTSSEILDTSGASPVWSAGPTLRQGRINGHGVILPDRKVLIFGGHSTHKWAAVHPGHSLESELYDPATNTTAPMASLNHPRMYHSAAVLLPDGTVLVAGGADPDPNNLGNTTIREWHMHFGPPDDFDYPADWEGPRIFRVAADATVEVEIPFNRKDYEIYRPTYLFTAGTAPVIDAVKRDGATITQATYGSTITIETPQAASIDAVALIRPGAATHHTDTEQRYVALEPITHVSANALSVVLPTNRNLAPPGYYMLWIVAAGKPCAEAKFIQLTEPPPGSDGTTGDRWCIVVTAAMGSPAAPEVVFLQALRAELRRGSAPGARFIAAANRIYYSASPAIARAMRRHPPLRAAVRAVIVRPSVALIRRARRVAGGSDRRLVAMLAAMGAIGLLLAPLLAAAVAAAVLVRVAQGRHGDGGDE